MALVSQFGRAHTLTTKNHGDQFTLGDSTVDLSEGGWQIAFIPSVDFAGSIAVLGRPANYQAANASVPFMPIPYKAITINNVASDYSFTGSTITGPSLILVPANGLSVALLVSCTAGAMDVYSLPITGKTDS